MNSTAKVARWAGFLAGAAFALVFSALAFEAHAGDPWGGAGGGAGGTSTGTAITGGTASRLLFSDGSTQVSTASPVAVTSSLDLTSGTLDVGGACTLDSTLRVDGASDLRGAISNGGNGTCFTGATGIPCFTEDIGVATSGTSAISLVAGTTASASGVRLRDNGGAQIGGYFGYGSTWAATDVRNKIGIAGAGTSNTIFTGIGTGVAAGTLVHEWRDGTSFENLLASIDGEGNLKLASSATRSRGTITLAAGTGTVTVASGSICVCGNTSALNAVQCNVSSTTLTATGTGTDVIAYHCL